MSAARRSAGCGRVEIVAEPVVVVDHVGDHLVGIVAEDIVLPAALRQEHLCPVIAAHLAFPTGGIGQREGRSEEHTSELQSLMRISYAVFCLKKKKTKHTQKKNKNIRNNEMYTTPAKKITRQ